MRIPFDSVVLAAVVEEIASYEGAMVQGVRQPDEHTVHLQLYRGGAAGEAGREAVLLLSCDPEFFRAHFVTRRAALPPQPPQFCAALRARIDGATLASVRQVGSDRLLMLRFESKKGNHDLVAELMGKHSNLVLIDGSNKIVSAAKWVGRDKSVRPISPRAEYVWPPVVQEDLIHRQSPSKPRAWADLAGSRPEQVSPFFKRLVQAEPRLPESWSPNLAPGQGAYPLDLRPLGIECHPRPSMSIALEQHFASAVTSHRLEARRAGLTGQLERVRLARETAISDLRQIQTAGAKTSIWQRTGELILAYGASAPPGARKLEVWDYDGEPVEIKVDPDLDFKQNAAIYFEKAKRAKGRAGHVEDQIGRLDRDREGVDTMLLRVGKAERLSDLEELWQEARERRWLTEQVHAASKEDRPYEGHRIRELMGPGGVKVLYGENAESNDYLTVRVARPNDYWLHIRGSTSAHVVIVTGNHPEKINREHLMFAAKVAVQNSPSKHAGFVPVDYTLKRYVRRPRGAPKGTALYTHEKTLHVES